MKYYCECGLSGFQFWAGAASNYDDLSKHDTAKEAVEAYLEDLTTTTDMSEAEINDFMWFELEDWLIEDGFKNVDGEWLD